jgi:hypothetical protein
MQRTLIVITMLTAVVCAPLTSFAQNLSVGNWVMNANGYKFVLEILTLNPQGNFTGRMEALNSTDADSNVSGTVSSTGRVEFSRGGQSYTGFIFGGREKDRHMAGTFSSGSENFGWFAEFQFPGVGIVTPLPPGGVMCPGDRQHCCEPLESDRNRCTHITKCVVAPQNCP